MSDSPGLAPIHTGKGLRGNLLTGDAFIFQVIFLLSDNSGHRVITHGVVWVFIKDFKYLGRTNIHTITTPVAFTRIDRNEIFTGAVFISIVC
jgi:hypothetical protein